MRRRLFDNSAVWCQITAHNRQPGSGKYRFMARAHNILRPVPIGSVDHCTQRFARRGERGLVQKIPNFVKNAHQPASFMQILHIAITRRFQINNHRRIAAKRIEPVQIKPDAHAPGHRGQMHNCIC